MLSAQGFGGRKKTIVLQRKLPAAAKLPGSSFSVKVVAQNPQYMDVAQKLQSVVETQMIRFNSDLSPTDDKPDATIAIRVLNYNLTQKAEADLGASSLTHIGTSSNRNQQQPTATRVTGNLAVTYQARARAGATIDAEPIEVKFMQVFDSTSEAVSKTKELFGKIPHPGRKSGRDDDTPHTMGDVEQLLVSRMADRVAARLVNTNEHVPVLLARGKLDDNNRYAEAGQWTQFVENLEMLAPLPSAEDDAYRLYNIGVGNEALGYKAETTASARRYFQQAVLYYRKAGDANTKEKYFIEPVNRIEIALEHYKTLAAPAKAAPAPGKAAAAPSKAVPAPSKAAPAKQGNGK
jgi:hypothetical protein